VNLLFQLPNLERLAGIFSRIFFVIDQKGARLIPRPFLSVASFASLLPSLMGKSLTSDAVVVSIQVVNVSFLGTTIFDEVRLSIFLILEVLAVFVDTEKLH
jgi:hypothetical protein